MKYYLAPMEGITGYIHRNAFHQFFTDADKYFTAFIAPNQNGKLSSREKEDILPEHNAGMQVVPQMLTNHAEDFILTAKRLKEYGYEEVNLNLGCPSKTVVSKYRGSGFLAKPQELERFLDEIFERSEMKISIKTRIGRDEPEEFYDLIKLYNKFPLEELIIHPRTQQDFYKNHPNLEIFKYSLEASKNPVCYNGDIFTVEDFRQFKSLFPNVETIMIGRGLLMNPGLTGMIESGKVPDKSRIKAFHDKIYTDYQEVLFGEKNVLFKMKELWSYMIQIFTDHKKYGKKIKKAQKLAAYESAVEMLFHEQEIDKCYGGL